MTTLVRKSSPFAGQGPGFNHGVAEAVYSTIMKCDSDDEARMLSTVLLGEMLSHELIVHGREISKAYREVIQKRAADMGSKLLEVAVVQKRAGGDPTPALQAIETLSEISKIAAYDPMMFTPRGVDNAHARAERARRQKRDLLTGRFAVDHKDVVHMPGEKPLSRSEAAVKGIPHTENVKLSARQQAQFQRGYLEVQELLDRYDGLAPNEAALHLNYETGKPDVIPFPTNGKLRIKAIHQGAESPGLDPKRKLASVALSVLPSTDLNGPGVQARVGDALGDGGLLNNDTWDVTQAGSLADELTRSTKEENYSPGTRALRRAGSLAEALHTSIDNDRHPRLSLALKVGQKAGELGPEAQKVIGPTADRTAYRYRGTQRKTVDERLRNAFSSVRGPGKREALIHGQDDDQGNWHEGAVLRYFRTRLPRADLNTLQRKSGTIPPSEGVIIDRKGNAAVQAIGYADDHYLPFNLKNLAKLKGGEYVRTRTFGGPTTEDIYTGLIGGARSLTVVSHNGVYTMEFDDDLKGGRRFNDKAARMVARYGQLLDAVKSQQVTTAGIHPSRLAELEDRASSIYDQDRDPEQYAAELERLKVAERRKPTLSARQRQEITSEFFAEQAARSHLAAPSGSSDKFGGTNRVGVGAADFAQDWAMRQVASMEARHRSLAAQNSVGYHPLSPAQRDQAARQVLEQAGGTEPDPVLAGQKLADAMGMRKQLDAYVTRKTDEYKKGLTPLQLNSQGYELALTALQEQFPYYIKRVDFHPWTDAAGDAFDTGYVAPKHNRPHAVLAGYFEEKILGHGKVRADSTRFQNFAVRGGKLDEVLTPKKATERATARAGAPAGAHAGAPDPEVAAHLRRESTMALINEIRRHVTFSPRVSIAQLRNEPVDNWLDHMGDKEKSGATNLHYLLTTPMEKLQAEARDSESKLRGTVNQALRENEKGGFFDLDPGLRRDYANEGRYERPKEIDSQNAVKHLDDPVGTEYSIPGSMYDQDAMHSPDEIDRAYHADPVIESVRGDLGSLADGHAFDAAAKDIRGELRRQYGELMRWKQRRQHGGAAGREPVAEHELQRRAEGLLRAQQLRRRHQEAGQRLADLSSPSPISPSQVVVIHGEPDEEMATRLGLGGSRVVNSDGGSFRDRNGISYTGD